MPRRFPRDRFADPGVFLYWRVMCFGRRPAHAPHRLFEQIIAAFHLEFGAFGTRHQPLYSVRQTQFTAQYLMDRLHQRGFNSQPG